MALMLPTDVKSPHPRLFALSITAMCVAGAILTVGYAGQLRDAAGIPAFWLMAGVALAAAARGFVATNARGSSAVITPTLCFSFAVLISWGLAPAIVVQSAAVIVVALRLRHPPEQAALIAGQYALSFAAAYTVLVMADREPFADISFTEKVIDAATFAAAAAAWLIAYSLLAALTIRLRSGRWWADALSPPHQALFMASLLLLSPVLAVAAHVNAALVLLVIVPLYAVQRMAALSAERDRAARVDPLTGLGNRRALQTRFAELAGQQPELGAPAPDQRARMALLLLDVDRFKYVNDALGHEVGDRLLTTIAQRLEHVTPDGGAIGRLGGDEFALIVPHLRHPDEAEQVAARLLAALAEPADLDGLLVDITASAGIAVYPDHGVDFTTLMRHADVAMYDAKRRGDTATRYEPASDHNGPQRLCLLTDFRRALEARDRNEITLHYQPQVALDTGEVVGVEALLRWRHPTRGPISTAELLQAAEHTAVMQSLTGWVIDEVISQVAAWQARGLTLRASFNISARDLSGDEVAARLSRRLVEHAVAPGRIQVEITESALMADAARAHATITQISALGVAVALDDFGTGYSSLQHLRKLPLSEIKIDRSFIAGMRSNSDDVVIVRSIVELARALELRTVAEGVETEYTWRMLRQIGCSAAQGWLTARPMPGEELPRWLARYRPRTAMAPAPVQLSQPAAVPSSSPDVRAARQRHAGA